MKIEAPPWREIHLPGLGPLRIRDSGPPEGAPDAPTILLIHGWTVSADLNWCRTYEPIARRARVVAWDQRGHGAGGLRTPGRMRMEALADDAAAVVRALGVGRATAVGYSMGGAVAQAMWRRHPDLLDGLVLCATAMAFGLTTTERRDFAIMGASSLPARLAAALGREELGWQAARRASERQAGTSMETGDADFDRYIDINLRSMFRLSREALPHLKRTRGNVLNIASVMGTHGMATQAPYAAAKGGVVAFTRQFAAEYGPEGARANAIAPGMILTPGTAGRFATGAYQARLIGVTPLQRYGSAEELASAAVFFCSDDASYVTGQILAVDGGASSSIFISDPIADLWAEKYDAEHSSA